MRLLRQASAPKWKSKMLKAAQTGSPYLIGSDYGNLGKMRSELVTTQNSIDRLTKARERATSSTTQAALDAQISVLKDSASSTEAYVKAHENVFSIFGWFFKPFS